MISKEKWLEGLLATKSGMISNEKMNDHQRKVGWSSKKSGIIIKEKWVDRGD